MTRGPEALPQPPLSSTTRIETPASAPPQPGPAAQTPAGTPAAPAAPPRQNPRAQAPAARCCCRNAHPQCDPTSRRRSNRRRAKDGTRPVSGTCRPSSRFGRHSTSTAATCRQVECGPNRAPLRLPDRGQPRTDSGLHRSPATRRSTGSRPGQPPTCRPARPSAATAPARRAAGPRSPQAAWTGGCARPGRQWCAVRPVRCSSLNCSYALLMG